MAKCAQCGATKAGRDKLCNSCRLRALNESRRKYVWTYELVSELRAAYSGRRAEVTARLDQLQGKT